MVERSFTSSSSVVVIQLLFVVCKKLMEIVKGSDAQTRNCFVETATLGAGEVSLKDHMQQPLLEVCW
jgi:hypothetical protein